MMNKVRLLIVCLCAGNLSSCSTVAPSYYTSYPNYKAYAYENTAFFPQAYEGSVNYGQYSQDRGEPSVPDSYYVGAYHSPTSHKEVDRNWVNGQNPNGYTIEIADGEKASQVAGKLYKAPKNERRAEIKYYRGTKSYYKGVYGNYNTYEEAQKALNKLPAEVKQGAGIKNWSSIQNNVRN